MASFPRSDTVLDSEFLLAITNATQANLAPSQRLQDFGRYHGGAQELPRTPRRELGDIIAKGTDLSLANDAQFQLGETLLAHAAAAPSGRAGRPLPARAGGLPGRRAEGADDRRAAGGACRGRWTRSWRNGAREPPPTSVLSRRLDEARLREQGKLEALQKKDDPVLAARIKAGGVFYSLRKYDETRVLMQALLPSVKKPEDEKLALNYLALSYAVQNLTDKAVAAYDRFQAKFPGDPAAENLTFTDGESCSRPATSPTRPWPRNTSMSSAGVYPKSHPARDGAAQPGARTPRRSATTTTRSAPWTLSSRATRGAS